MFQLSLSKMSYLLMVFASFCKVNFVNLCMEIFDFCKVKIIGFTWKILKPIDKRD